MKKIILKVTLTLIVLVGFFCIGYHFLDDPANVRIIGAGCIQQQNGVYFIEIDSVRYACGDNVYVVEDRIGSDVTNVCKVVENQNVTVFQMRNSIKPEFIVGNHSKFYLDKLFSRNLVWTFLPVLLVALIISMVFIFRRCDDVCA